MARPRTGNAPLSAAERMRRYRAKADLIRTLARAHGAVSIELFGSAARDEDRADSDIDIMVELGPGRSLLDLIGLSDDLEMALGRKVDAISKSAIKPRVPLAARLRQSVPAWPQAAAQARARA